MAGGSRFVRVRLLDTLVIDDTRRILRIDRSYHQLDHCYPLARGIRLHNDLRPILHREIPPCAHTWPAAKRPEPLPHGFYCRGVVQVDNAAFARESSMRDPLFGLRKGLFVTVQAVGVGAHGRASGNVVAVQSQSGLWDDSSHASRICGVKTERLLMTAFRRGRASISAGVGKLAPASASVIQGRKVRSSDRSFACNSG